MNRFIACTIFLVSCPLLAQPQLFKEVRNLNSSSQPGVVVVSDAVDGNLRRKMLRNKGLALGTQAGEFWATNVINQYLKENSDIWDISFDFRPLLIEVNGYLVKPPVILQTDGRVAKASPQIIRAAEITYRIVSEPKFVTKDPNWRDYLLRQPKAPEIGYIELLPSSEDKKEITLWQDSVDKGWDLGVMTAIRGHESRVALMVQDYQGMIRYHLMRDRNMVTEPQFDKQFYAVTGGGSKMTVNDVTVRISVNPRLNQNFANWEAVPSLPAIQKLFPRGIQQSRVKL